MDFVSTTILAQQCGADAALLFEDLNKSGWITRKHDKWELTEKGKQKGGIIKQHAKFGEYIAWPQNIDLTSLGSSDNNNWINATTIGNYFNTSSQRMNLVLSELGWMQKHVSGWLITKQGKAIGGRQCEHETSGAKFVLWSEDILQNKNLLSVFQEEKKPMPNHEPRSENVIKQPPEQFREKFEAKHRTQDGHYVRSRAELIIDNLLYQYSLAHAYERKLPIEEDLYCDFYLPAGKVYIEYWGLENDQKYIERKKVKQALYKKYEFKLIELNDDDILNLDDVLPKKLLKFDIKVY